MAILTLITDYDRTVDPAVKYRYLMVEQGPFENPHETYIVKFSPNGHYRIDIMTQNEKDNLNSLCCYHKTKTVNNDNLIDTFKKLNFINNTELVLEPRTNLNHGIEKSHAEHAKTVFTSCKALTQTSPRFYQLRSSKYQEAQPLISKESAQSEKLTNHPRNLLIASAFTSFLILPAIACLIAYAILRHQALRFAKANPLTLGGGTDDSRAAITSDPGDINPLQLPH